MVPPTLTNNPPMIFEFLYSKKVVYKVFSSNNVNLQKEKDRSSLLNTDEVGILYIWVLLFKETVQQRC